MTEYLHLRRESTGKWHPGISTNLGCSNSYCTIFEIVDNGGDDVSLKEYKEPERLFSLRADDDMILSRPYGQKTWSFDSSEAVDYFELMPDTGDYRKLSDDEIAVLRKENEAKA
jgi:hypothetical protein